MVAAGALLGGAWGVAPRSAQKEPSQPPEPYIEVTSVTVRPDAIHEEGKPDEASLIVKVSIHGRVPSGSTAEVYVGTYSSDPPKNDVAYVPVAQTMVLGSDPTVYEFKVRAAPGTVNGSLIIAAGLGAVTQGINKTDPPADLAQWHAKLETIVP